MTILLQQMEQRDNEIIKLVGQLVKTEKELRIIANRKKALTRDYDIAERKLKKDLELVNKKIHKLYQKYSLVPPISQNVAKEDAGNRLFELMKRDNILLQRFGNDER